MQPVVIMNFRKRLKKRGYTEVSIYMDKIHSHLYIVYAVEPLGGNKIQAIYDFRRMNNAFRF